MSAAFFLPTALPSTGVAQYATFGRFTRRQNPALGARKGFGVQIYGPVRPGDEAYRTLKAGNTAGLQIRGAKPCAPCHGRDLEPCVLVEAGYATPTVSLTGSRMFESGPGI